MRSLHRLPALVIAVHREHLCSGFGGGIYCVSSIIFFSLCFCDEVLRAVARDEAAATVYLVAIRLLHGKHKADERARAHADEHAELGPLYAARVLIY